MASRTHLLGILAVAGMFITAPVHAVQLHDAAQKGDSEEVGRLIAQGADVNAIRSNGTTALMLAAVRGHGEVVSLLLLNGADANTQWDRGTALVMASSRGYEAIVRDLIEQGANLNLTDESGLTALHLAAYYGYVRIVEFLLSNGADTLAGDEDGLTPERYASTFANLDVMQMLAPDGTTEEVEPWAIARRVQELLVEVGLEPDSATGIIEQRTRTAVLAFQQNLALPETGRIDDRLIDQLVVALDPSARCDMSMLMTERGMSGFVKDCDPGHPRFYNRDRRRVCPEATNSAECDFRRRQPRP